MTNENVACHGPGWRLAHCPHPPMKTRNRVFFARDRHEMERHGPLRRGDRFVLTAETVACGSCGRPTHLVHINGHPGFGCRPRCFGGCAPGGMPSGYEPPLPGPEDFENE